MSLFYNFMSFYSGFRILKLRLYKLWSCLTTPFCWQPLLKGVAPAVEHRYVLKSLHPDLIIDVGANRGQFSLVSRMLFPFVPIYAFEPIPFEASVFKSVHVLASHVHLFCCAIGHYSGHATLHLSASSDSSSLLPIGKVQTRLFPNTSEVGTLNVPITRLDEYFNLWCNNTALLLKIDVQGFELNVLRGSLRTLSLCAYVYVECSDIALYKGQSLQSDVHSFLLAHGFFLSCITNKHIVAGSLVQADYLYVSCRLSPDL